jgi:hypothetical protein
MFHDCNKLTGDENIPSSRVTKDSNGFGLKIKEVDRVLHFQKATKD